MSGSELRVSTYTTAATAEVWRWRPDRIERRAQNAPEIARIGVIYFDTHADLNVPASVPEGALDWMGMAHMLGEPGAVDEVVHAGPRVPLLDPDQVILFAWGPEQSTEYERAAIERHGLEVVPVESVSADPRRRRCAPAAASSHAAIAS